jgi:hypothetical protein
MKQLVAFVVLSAVNLLSVSARSERLEFGIAASPTWLYDSSYEAFSEKDMYVTRFGVDIRSEVADLSGFAFAPLVGYRFGRDMGYITWDIDTYLRTHDVFAGLRVKRELIPWLSVFAEIEAGAVIAVMDAAMNTDRNINMYSAEDLNPSDEYEETKTTWSVGALVGLETHLSRRRLAARGNSWFCFGGEIAVGYLRRGDLTFDPSLRGGGDNAIAAETLGKWGDVNLSGLVLQVGASLYFL